MKFLTMGENALLDFHQFDVTLRWPDAVGTLDVSLYLLAADGKVRSDDDMIFYNQPADPTGGVKIADIADGSTLIRLDLDRLPAAVDRIAICLTVEKPGKTMAAFAGTSASAATYGVAWLEFRPELDRASEVAMRMVEVYRRNGGWRIRAVGQGYNAGLDALARSFGVVIENDEPSSGDDDDTPSAAATEAPAQPEPPAPEDRSLDPPPAPAPREPVVEDEEPEIEEEPLPPPSLADGGVALTADRPTHNWPLAGNDTVTVELVWQCRQVVTRPRPRSFELELGCYYELADPDAGRSGVIQLWDDSGKLDRKPFIQLDAMVMDGKTGRQKLSISGKHLRQIRQITLYAYIPDGAPNWSGASLALTVRRDNAMPVSLTLDEGQDGCAIVGLMTLAVTEQELGFTHHAHFAPRHPDLDAKFGWGLPWRARRSHLIH